MRNWLSSDWHLGHANIAGKDTSNWNSGYRDFSSVEEMNHTIIDNINKYVDQDDTIWFHGDFAFGGHTKIPDFRRRIYCKNIHIILGNHDHHLTKYADYFSSIQHVKQKTFVLSNGRKVPIFMSHYAHRIWEGSHKGFIHSYGHSHASLEHSPNGRSADCGIDNAYRLFGEYRPFEVEEFVNMLEKRPVHFIDHHNENTNVR
jgi:calcineurin-like phosphoesterase family protein